MKDQEIIDIEEHALQGKEVPKRKKYRIRIDREKYVVDVECLTGEEILQLAGKTPFNRFQLNQKKRGTVEKIEYEQKVDFTTPGIERFMTLPLDQTEG